MMAGRCNDGWQYLGCHCNSYWCDDRGLGTKRWLPFYWTDKFLWMNINVINLSFCPIGQHITMHDVDTDSWLTNTFALFFYHLELYDAIVTWDGNHKLYRIPPPPPPPPPTHPPTHHPPPPHPPTHPPHPPPPPPHPTPTPPHPLFLSSFLLYEDILLLISLSISSSEWKIPFDYC